MHIPIFDWFQIPFAWHISYAGGNDHEYSLGPGEHTNHQCSCLPHDMQVEAANLGKLKIIEDLFCVQVILADGFYCYHYMVDKTLLT